MGDPVIDQGIFAVTDTLVVTGIGECLPGTGPEEEALPFLKSRKTLKFMGKQDKLAVAAAGKALHEAGVSAGEARAAMGLYLAVGHIPFERADIEVLAANSMRAGAFSMDLFSRQALDQINPLLTFRCLPNMPLFHVSLNFGIEGPSFVTYPGAGQFYLALERAARALEAGKVAQALVGGVADQDNYLVDFHLRRVPATRRWKARDAAAFLCLEKRSTAEARGAAIRLELLSLRIDYQAPDPFATPPDPEETLAWENGSYRADPESGQWGPASPVRLLAQGRSGGKAFAHGLATLDGFEAESRWRIP